MVFGCLGFPCFATEDSECANALLEQDDEFSLTLKPTQGSGLINRIIPKEKEPVIQVEAPVIQVEAPVIQTAEPVIEVQPMVSKTSAPPNSLTLQKILNSQVIKNDYKGSIPDHTPVSIYSSRSEIILDGKIIHAPDMPGSNELLITPLPNRSLKPYWVKFDGTPLDYTPLRSTPKIYALNESSVLVGTRNFATIYDLKNTKYTILKFKDFEVAQETRIHSDDWTYLPHLQTIVRVYTSLTHIHIQSYKLKGLDCHPYMEFIKEKKTAHKINIVHWGLSRIVGVNKDKIKLLIERRLDESDYEKGNIYWPGEFNLDVDGQGTIQNSFPLPKGADNWVIDEQANYNPVYISHTGEVYQFDLATGKPTLLQKFPELNREGVTPASWRSGSFADNGNLLLVSDFGAQPGLYIIELKNSTIHKHRIFENANITDVKVLAPNMISLWQSERITIGEHKVQIQKTPNLKNKGEPSQQQIDKNEIYGSRYIIIEPR
jgi:hypothetical protein